MRCAEWFNPCTLPSGSCVGVRALERGLPAELSKHRGDNDRARDRWRPPHAASLIEQDTAGAHGNVSSVQAPGEKLANGQDLRKDREPVKVPPPDG